MTALIVIARWPNG